VLKPETNPTDVGKGGSCWEGLQGLWVLALGGEWGMLGKC